MKTKEEIEIKRHVLYNEANSKNLRSSERKDRYVNLRLFLWRYFTWASNKEKIKKLEEENQGLNEMVSLIKTKNVLVCPDFDSGKYMNRFYISGEKLNEINLIEEDWNAISVMFASIVDEYLEAKK